MQARLILCSYGNQVETPLRSCGRTFTDLGINFKIYDITDKTKEIFTTYTFPNISRSKSDQTMKFSHFIEYNMRNIFLQNHTQNGVEKAFPDPFIEKKKKNQAYLWINNLKYKVRFYCMNKWRSTKIY